ncbi:hypothetical protein [Candidatus Binatus sp.]|uniref:hypothetical protein n=1 Tax=Candidatus Binatus sp. TaxID=2811406 RepID=UPI003BB1D8B8
MRDRDQPSTRVAAEVSNPSVVGFAVCRRKLCVEKFGLPEQSDRGIENRFRHRLFVEQLEPLLHHHGSEGRALEVGVLGFRREHPHLLGLGVATHRALAQFPRVLDLLTHATERSEQARRRHLRPLAIYFEILEAVIADPNAHRAFAILRIDVLLPEVGRFEDMSVAIDNQFFGFHSTNSAIVTD